MSISSNAVSARNETPATRDFKEALGKEDFDLIIDSLKSIPTELTLPVWNLRYMMILNGLWSRYMIE